MELSKEDLRDVFKKAQEKESDYIFVGIEAEGVQEIICIPNKSFVEKLAFYERSYSDELVHVMNKNVFIYTCSYGNSSELDRM